MSSNSFRRGDIVEVRSPSEILATLDEKGSLEYLPFMPEMAAYCGRRFRVDGRSEKICDTVNWSGSRRLHNSVLLADLRCDGAKHGGCQAECRLFWKEIWLRKVDKDSPAATSAAHDEMQALMQRISANVKQAIEVDGKLEERWKCQATELPKATEHLLTFDPRPYVREYTCGNVPLGRFVRVTARATLEESLRKIGLISEIGLAGTGPQPNPEPGLNLQPGDLVQVKSKEEIAATLNLKGYNRGLWFDREMLAYCGGTFRVRQCIRRFINDVDGKMIEMKSDAVTLESVICTGDLALRRWLCPRAIFAYWRDCWLRRVDASMNVSQ